MVIIVLVLWAVPAILGNGCGIQGQIYVAWLQGSKMPVGGSHKPAFMSSCLTISHTLYLPYLPSTRGVLVFYGLL